MPDSFSHSIPCETAGGKRIQGGGEKGNGGGGWRANAGGEGEHKVRPYGDKREP